MSRRVTTTAAATSVPPGLKGRDLIRRAIVAELLDVRIEYGRVPNWVIEQLAADVGQSPRTLWRWLADAQDILGDDAPAELLHLDVAPSLTDVEIEVVYAHLGKLAPAYKELRAAGKTDIKSLSTFRRAWKRLDPAVRAMATDGAKGVQAVQLCTRWQAPERNHTWQMDHEELPVWVMPRGRSTPEKSWVTVVEDDNTRYVLAVLVTFGTPTAEQVVAAIADAIRRKDTTVAGQWVGGVPLRILTDNGGDYVSALCTQSLVRLGITHRRSYPYSPHQKGKVERFNQTSQHEFAARLPGYAYGPRTLKQKDFYGLGGTILDEVVLIELLLDWVEQYNTERPHSALGGRTPLEAWCEQYNPLREVDPQALRLAMLLEAKPRKVHPDGVFFDNRYYQRGALAGYVGRKVNIRHLPYDRSFVEVFDGDTWICTAFPHADLTEDERDDLERLRRQQYTNARVHLAATAERRAMAVETGKRPGLLPAAAIVRDESLSDGDMELMRLLGPDADLNLPRLAGADAPAPETTNDPDPWELALDGAGDDDLSQLDDLEGFDTP